MFLKNSLIYPNLPREISQIPDLFLFSFEILLYAPSRDHLQVVWQIRIPV